MPLEIKEIVIKATIGNPNQGGENTADSGEDSAGGLPSKDEIINEAVSQMMQILRDKKER
jgi:hypothetical protein